MTLRIGPNPDPEFLKEITQRLIDNDGYCPCVFESKRISSCARDFQRQGFRSGRASGFRPA